MYPPDSIFDYRDICATMFTTAVFIRNYNI